MVCLFHMVKSDAAVYRLRGILQNVDLVIT